MTQTAVRPQQARWTGGMIATVVLTLFLPLVALVVAIVATIRSTAPARQRWTVVLVFALAWTVLYLAVMLHL